MVCVVVLICSPRNVNKSFLEQKYFNVWGQNSGYAPDPSSILAMPQVGYFVELFRTFAAH